MEKSCHSSSSGAAAGGGGDSSITTASSATTTSSSITTTISISSSSNNNTNNRDVYLKHLNKISHKISKPVRRLPLFDQNNQEISAPPPPQVQPPQNQGPAAAQSQQSQQQQQQQHQPPVYNINKNDFRDVVQRLTGSPAHERFSTPPPIQPPKPPSSRLQRIRPPPLAQISNRPPPLPQINNPMSYGNPTGGSAPVAGFLGCQRQPLSPLPPFPAVHASAESPISAYMRFLQSSVSSAASPKWNNFQPQQMPPPPPPHQQQQNIPPPSQGFPQHPMLPPTSPLAFGCIPSPRSPYALLSPSLLFSPTGQLGFPQLPLSPSLPVPSPRWKGI